MKDIAIKLSCCLLLCFAPLCLKAVGDAADRARELYDAGLYAEAMGSFQNLPSYGVDPVVDAYVVMCALKLRVEGYENMVTAFCESHPSSAFRNRIIHAYALNLFDEGQYARALEFFNRVRENRIPAKYRAELAFKRGYCFLKTGSEGEALNFFGRVCKMGDSDYAAPAAWCSAYIHYCNGDFAKAIPLFELSAQDERFALLSKYYCINSLFYEKHYDTVLSKGVPLFAEGKLDENRQASLARLLSETCLLRGDKDGALKYFGLSSTTSGTADKTRGEFFYEGSLMYATGNYAAAVEKFDKITPRNDSLAQIAIYQTALCCLKTGDRVKALGCFEETSKMDFDKKMKEDAAFNYAKLAFDVNGATQPFHDYLKEYSDKVRGEKIYSYMALAGLSDADWQGAIDFYDKMDVLEGADKWNYIRASYLRGVQLLDAGSYRNASQCFMTVEYYVPMDNRLGQLTRYALAQTYYLNGEYDKALAKYRDLYNNSALYSLREADLLPYNIGYCCFSQKNTASAGRWFTSFVSSGVQDKALLRDARLRTADCLFADSNYKEACETYQQVASSDNDKNLIYPYYRAGLCQGLLRKNKEKMDILMPALEADPKADYYSEALYELGKAALSVKQRIPAAKAFNTLSKEGPDGPYKAMAMLESGTMKRNAGDVDGAILRFKEVVANPAFGDYAKDALLALESIYQSRGNTREYLAYLDSLGKGFEKTDAQKAEMTFAAAEQLFYAEKYADAQAAFDAYAKDFPDSAASPKVKWYLAGCSEGLRDLPLACDRYAAVISGADSVLALKAALKKGAIELSMQDYKAAQSTYAAARNYPADAAQTRELLSGLSLASLKAGDYDVCRDASQQLLKDNSLSAAARRECTYSLAKSLMALGRRDEALKHYRELAKNPLDEQGAGAAYVIIKDLFDKGEYKTVEDKVFAFASSGTKCQRPLARAFIILGDSYVLTDRPKQALATYQSIAEGYTVADDGVLDTVKEKISALKENMAAADAQKKGEQQ